MVRVSGFRVPYFRVEGSRPRAHVLDSIALDIIFTKVESKVSCLGLRFKGLGL